MLGEGRSSLPSFDELNKYKLCDGYSKIAKQQKHKPQKVASWLVMLSSITGISSHVKDQVCAYEDMLSQISACMAPEVHLNSEEMHPEMVLNRHI